MTYGFFVFSLTGYNRKDMLIAWQFAFDNRYGVNDDQTEHKR